VEWKKEEDIIARSYHMTDVTELMNVGSDKPCHANPQCKPNSLMDTRGRTGDEAIRGLVL